MASDYSYIFIRVGSSADDTIESISFGDSGRSELPANPLPLFINADEAYTLSTSGGYDIVCLWKGSEVAALGVRRGCRVSARAVVKLLRECLDNTGLTGEEMLGMYGFPEKAQESMPAAASESEGIAGMRTFTSTSALTDIVSAFLGGGSHAGGCVVAVDATAVPAVDEDTLPRLRPSSLPDFEIETPPVAKPAPRKPIVDRYYAADPEEEEEEEAVKPRRRRRSFPVFIVLVLVAIAIGWALVNYLPDIMPAPTDYASIESTDVSDTAVLDSIEAYNASIAAPAADTAAAPADTAAAVAADTARSVQTAQPAEQSGPEPAAISADEKADIDYLNANRVWKRASLRSKAGKALFDSFAAADINAIASDPYFAVEGRCNNRDALKAVNLLWRAYRTETQRSNERELRKLKGKETIDMHALVITLARFQDSKPNKSPRPRINNR